MALHKGFLKTAIETGPKSGILFSAEEVTGKAVANIAEEAGQVIAKNPEEAAVVASKALAPKSGGVGNPNASMPATFGKLEAEGFTAPTITANKHGQLTNGTYTLDQAGMQTHLTGSLAGGKQQQKDTQRNVDTQLGFG